MVPFYDEEGVFMSVLCSYRTRPSLRMEVIRAIVRVVVSKLRGHPLPSLDGDLSVVCNNVQTIHTQFNPCNMEALVILHQKDIVFSSKYFWDVKNNAPNGDISTHIPAITIKEVMLSVAVSKYVRLFKAAASGDKDQIREIGWKSSSCNLCDKFAMDTCIGCPIREKSGVDGCRNTPWGNMAMDIFEYMHHSNITNLESAMEGMLKMITFMNECNWIEDESHETKEVMPM